MGGTMSVQVRAAIHRTDFASPMRAPWERHGEVGLAPAAERQMSWLAILAHELRLPLAPLRNSLELLGQRPNDPALVAQVRATMDRQVLHLARLVDQLLDVTRLARGVMEVACESVNCSEVISTALETTRPIMEARRHQLVTEVPAAPLLVAGDFTRLTQVVTNLLVNAAKYTDSPGVIRLAIGIEDDHIVIRVRDSGRGIPPEMLARIFDMFVQVETSADRTQGGLGVGLTLARSFV